jgi:hypothetical protein
VKSFRRLSCQKLFVMIFASTLILFSYWPVGAQDQPLADVQQTQIPSSTPATTLDPAPNNDAGWHFSVSPYLWLAGARGSLGGPLGRDVSIHASIGDLLSHFDFGLMGAAEARRGRIVLNGDMLWIRLSDSRAIPFAGLGAVSADARAGQFVWTSKVGYRLINQEHFKVDANVGVRYWHLGQKLSFNPSLLGIDFNGSQSWADVLVGGRVQLPVRQGEKAVVNLFGDVGGWNASAKLDYQWGALLGYKVCPKWTLQAGYRYLFIDYRQNGGSINTVTSGPLLGMTYTFK